MAVAIVASFFFLTSTTVPKCLPLEIVLTNGIWLTCNMSISEVTFLCPLSISLGRSSVTVTMQLVFLRMILTCSNPMLVPKLSSALSMLAFLTGLLGSVFFHVFDEITCIRLPYDVL